MSTSKKVAAPAPRERPIIFTGPMLLEVLAGRKTQTRRVPKLPRSPNNLGKWEPGTAGGAGVTLGDGTPAPEEPVLSHTRTGATVGCPYGRPGDRLWVRETWGEDYRGKTANASAGNRQYTCPVAEIVYRADGHEMGESGTGWRSGRFMPRRACRLVLEITGVRVERLQAITEADIRAEGITPEVVSRMTRSDVGHVTDLRTAWWIGWDSINGQRPGCAWNYNPFVWVLTFRRVS